MPAEAFCYTHFKIFSVCHLFLYAIFSFILTGINGQHTSGIDSYSMTKIGLREYHNQYNDFKIFPNPTNHYLNIKMNHELIGNDFKIYNLTGSLILMKRINKMNDKIDVSSLAIEVYMIHYEGRVQKLMIGR